MQISLYRSGFISVSADEFSRGIQAARWSLQPSVNVMADAQSVWLPFEKYLNGLALLVWNDVILAPRFSVFLASCFLLVALYGMSYYLFASFPVAILTSLLVTFQPWYAWLSGTPMLEMYYLASFVAGLAFLLVWLKEARSRYWLWAGLCFSVASGFHVQSWTIINLVNFLTLGFAYKLIRQKQVGRLWRLIAFYFLGNALIIAFAILQFIDSGEILPFLSEHTSYSRWFYGGYDVPVLEKFLYYPEVVISHSSAFFWAVLVVGLVFLSGEVDRRWRLFPLAISVMSLTLNSVANIYSGPPSAAPGRYSLLFMLMLSPYVAYGAYRLLGFARRQPSRATTYSLAALSVGLIIYLLGWGASRIPNYPQGMPLDAVETGRALNRLLVQGDSADRQAYMIERKYWDFLGVALTAGHFDSAIYDRAYDIRNRDLPSILGEEVDDIRASLTSQNVRYVALTHSSLKAKAQETGFLWPKQKVGEWTIYEFRPGL